MRENRPEDRCACEKPWERESSALCGNCLGNLPESTLNLLREVARLERALVCIDEARHHPTTAHLRVGVLCAEALKRPVSE